MKSVLIHSCSIIALLAFSPVVAHAQTAATSAHWEAALKIREQRAAVLRDEVKAIDTRIEERVDGITEALRAIGDSKDTRTKVARMKRDTIDRLQKSIDYYRQKRAAMQEELRRPTWHLTEEQKRTVIAKFDERIEKRVAQIIALQKSLPVEKDYDRYKATGSNWAGTTYEVNEDHRQNARLTSHTNAQRDEVVAGLRASIARIEQQNRSLEALNAPADEIAKNDALLAERRKQLAAALAPTETPTRAIGSKEAADLDKALKIAIDDLRRDHHPRCFTIWMAGGGIKPGQVYGETDEFGYNIVRDPVHVHDLHATLLHLLGVDHKKLTYRHEGRDYRLTDVSGNVVKALLA